MKKYVVAEGYAFTANGHIYSAGEEISESVFSDKTYFAKLLAEKKILVVEEKSAAKEEKAEDVRADADAENLSKRSLKKSKAD